MQSHFSNNKFNWIEWFWLPWNIINWDSFIMVFNSLSYWSAKECIRILDMQSEYLPHLLTECVHLLHRVSALNLFLINPSHFSWHEEKQQFQHTHHTVPAWSVDIFFVFWLMWLSNHQLGCKVLKHYCMRHIEDLRNWRIENKSTDDRLDAKILHALPKMSIQFFDHPMSVDRSTGTQYYG